MNGLCAALEGLNICCRCQKFLPSILSWKKPTYITHKIRQMCPLLIICIMFLPLELTYKTRPCARYYRKDSSCSPNKICGGLNVYKDLQVPSDCTFTTLEMEQAAWEELPGIIVSLFLKHFRVLYLVPAISCLGDWRKSINFYINQVFHFLEEKERERKRCCCCLTI